MGASQGLAWRRQETFLPLRPGSELASADISGIVDDQLGHLWLATSRGVLRAARAEVIEMAEGKCMAAELHDSLDQSLSIIQNHAVLAGIHRHNQASAAPHLQGISQTAVKALARVREICQRLRPVELDRLGLTRTLQAVTDRLAERMGLPSSSEFDPVDSLLLCPPAPQNPSLPGMAIEIVISDDHPIDLGDGVPRTAVVRLESKKN